MRQRVLILIKGLGRGGAEQLLASSAPFLDRDRFDYRFAYLLPWKDQLAGDLVAAGFRVGCLGDSRGRRWLGRLRRVLRDDRIDLIHSHLPLAGVGSRIVGASARNVYTEHNVWECYHPATYWANLSTLGRCDYVFAVSDHVRASMRYPRILAPVLSAPRVETLYHGIDAAEIRRRAGTDGVRHELGISQTAPVVGTVANFRSEKGLDKLVCAADVVRRSVPDVRFVLVGSGPLEREIRDLVTRRRLGDTVVFAGHRDDVPRLASIFDVFAMSSLHEGLSIALIEAMALGKPAVVTDAGGLAEVIEHDRQGLVVPSGRVAPLAEAIASLLRDPDLRRRMGLEAKLRASDFDVRRAVTRIETVYRGLLT